MAVCRYFMQGSCKYGNKCWNDHPKSGNDQGYGNAQRQLNFGGGGSSVFRNAAGNNQNPYKWLSNDGQNQQKSNQQVVVQVTPAEIVKSFQAEMLTWDQSKMWPFSCFGWEKDAPSIPGFSDYSQEELRFEAYEAQKSGNIQPYVEKIQQLVSDFSIKKQELKKPSMQLRQQLTDFIEDSRRKKSTGQQPTGSSFGASGSGSSVFGNSGSNLFGGQQSSSTGSNLFGNKTGSSVFQSTQNTGSSVFGSQRPAGSSVFGSKPAAGSSVFGSQQSTGTGVFGSQTPSTSSVFGSPAGQKTSVFGSQQQPTGSSVFGSQTQPNAFSSTQPAPAFGSTQNSSGSAGAFSQTPFGTSTAQTAFGQTVSLGTSVIAQETGTTAVNSNPFGQNSVMSNTTPSFGGTSAQTGVQPSPFGQPQQPAVSNQQFSTSSPSAMPSQTAQTTSVSSSVTQKSGPTVTYGTHTPLDKLSAEERTQFEAPKFILGRIPTRPPPREFV